MNNKTPKQLLTNYNYYKTLYPSLKNAGENWLDEDDLFDVECELLNELIDSIFTNKTGDSYADTQAGIGPITVYIEGGEETTNGKYYQWEASEEENHFTKSLTTTNNFDDFITKLSTFYYNILNDPKYYHEGEWNDYT